MLEVPRCFLIVLSLHLPDSPACLTGTWMFTRQFAVMEEFRYSYPIYLPGAGFLMGEMDT